MEILKKRVGNDLVMRLTISDSGIVLDWSDVTVISAHMYSDGARITAGRCRWSLDPNDHTVLVVTYGPDEPQYLGYNRLVLSCECRGYTATYDQVVVNYVPLTEMEGTETVADVAVSLSTGETTEGIAIAVESISSSIIGQLIDDTQEAKEQALAAADRANTISDDLSERVRYADVVDGLDSTESDKPLSANQGRVLDSRKQDKTSLVSDLATKVNALSSSDRAAFLGQIGAASEESLQSHENDNTRHITAGERVEWNGKQDTISDLDAIRAGAAKGATALQSIPAEYVTETELEDMGFATTTQVGKKQDIIADLADIRSGAAKGATALQSYTETDPIYLKDKPNIALKSEIPDISGKANVTDLTKHTENTNIHVTASDKSAWNSKQDAISDLAAIRSGASKGATALQSYTEKYTGTITGITMNGTSKGTSGVVNLGTVITEHQDISGKADKSSLAVVATSGSYNDLSNKPTIPSEQVNADWNATSGKAQILNKPTIPSAVTESIVSGWGFTKNTGTYSKPSTGIPKSDLESAVQTSLGKADTALQSYTEQYKGTITGVSANGTSVATSGVANIPAASTSVYGVTKLSSATNSTSTSLAATASAVKAAYDLANSYKGTVTGVKINGTTKNPSSGVVDLGTVITDISGKQDTISDLATIRSGAAKGATALQSYTETDPVYTADKPNIAQKIAIVTKTSGATSYAISPNKITQLGTLASSVTISLNTTEEETGFINIYDIIFTTPSAAPSITWPEGITWVGGSAPAIAGGKTYEVSIMNGLATYGEF